MTDLFKNGVSVLDMIKPSNAGDAAAMWIFIVVLFLASVAGLIASIAFVITGIRAKNGAEITYGIFLLAGGLLLGYVAINATIGVVHTDDEQQEIQYLLYVPDEVMDNACAKTTFDSCFNVVDHKGNLYYVTVKPQDGWLTYDKASEIVKDSFNSVGDPNCDHDWKFKTSQEPTGTSDGYCVLQCSKCGATRAETIYHQASHIHVTTIVKTIEPTCTEFGTTYYVCMICGSEFNSGEFPLHHQGYTVTENGVTRCTLCGESWADEEDADEF